MNKLIIALLDLENTTTQIPMFEDVLKQAYNKQITYLPVAMETTNPIYYRDVCSVPAGRWCRNGEPGTYQGFRYEGLTDDRRAINAFMSDAFNMVKLIAAGRNQIVVLHSETYVREATMLTTLIKGLQLECEVIQTTEL